MSKDIFSINNNINIINTRESIYYYVSQYNFNSKYKNYLTNNKNDIKYNTKVKNNLKNDSSDSSDLDDWVDCDDILAYNEAYDTVMYIKNNCGFITKLGKYFSNIGTVLDKRESKFIKEQAKTEYERMFFEYYEYLLRTEL
jgi:hypothetical protein